MHIKFDKIYNKLQSISHLISINPLFIILEEIFLPYFNLFIKEMNDIKYHIALTYL